MAQGWGSCQEWNGRAGHMRARARREGKTTVMEGRREGKIRVSDGIGRKEAREEGSQEEKEREEGGKERKEGKEGIMGNSSNREYFLSIYNCSKLCKHS
jgi:hypothetical protein